MCFCISAVVKNIVISLRCAPATLSDFAHRVSLSPCYVHAALADAYASKAGSDPQEVQGDTHDKRGTDADVFLSPGSEHFFCSSNWLFATNVFYNEDVFWAGGNDTCALAQSQLNKLLELCTGIKWIWDSHTPRLWAILPSAPDAADLCRIQVVLFHRDFMLLTGEWWQLAKNIYCSERQSSLENIKCK